MKAVVVQSCRLVVSLAWYGPLRLRDIALDLEVSYDAASWIAGGVCDMKLARKRSLAGGGYEYVTTDKARDLLEASA